MTQTKTFEPDGRAVPYIDEGEGDGPVLLLVLDRGFEGGALGSVAHILAEAGYRVLRVGTGEVADVLAVMDHIGLEDAWIGGHAAGGTVARAFAAAHTDRANGLLLLGVEDVDIALSPMLPVLIMQGSDDDVTPPANGERLKATAAHLVTTVTIDGAGHLFPMTHPVDTALPIEDYLDWD
ncbi:MAG: alpha/beta hydrolase [Microbacterium sp.]